MWKSIKDFIKDPEPTASFDEVSPGLNLAEGIVHVDEPLRSPVRGQNCVAYFYRSFLVMTEGRAPAIHKLKEAEVYAPFELQMDGGTLEVIPAKPGRFDRSDHTDLQRRYTKGFQATEEIIMPGARVRVRGKVKRLEGRLVCKMTQIDVIDKQVASAGVVGNRKKRRQKKKK